ncbi:MAG: DUF2804 domain-containing protein [Sneathiella sp.]|nr:DUF2804 domain-containing protein [Sneathiella sp.]
MINFVTEKGNVPFGFFKQPMGLINYQDFQLRDATRRILPSSAREERFVHFHFMGFTSNRFIAGCSLSKSSAQTAVFFYLFDRQKSELVLKKGCRIDEGNAALTLNPDDGLSWLSGRGKEVSFDLSNDNLYRKLFILLDGSPLLELYIQEREMNTLRLCTPTGPSGWTYVQKIAGAPASGKLIWQGVEIDLLEDGATAHYDFTAGFLRRETFWNWACITGISETGDMVGLNLSNGVNETGIHENVVWLNGKMTTSPSVFFEYDLDDLSKPWRIQDQEGKTDLQFTPDGAYTAFHPDNPNPVDFTQAFGRFQGQISAQNGKILQINNLPGFTERQYSVWW